MAAVAAVFFAFAGFLAVEASATDRGIPQIGDGVTEPPTPQSPTITTAVMSPPASMVTRGEPWTLQGYQERLSVAHAEPSEPAGPLRSVTGPVGPVAPEVRAPSRISGPNPARIRIPALDVDASMIGLGLTSVGQIEVPADPAQAGWWRDGPEPGEAGPSVILGHVDSYRGPGVFYGLNLLRHGDEIMIDRVDGSTVVYAVSRANLYDKNSFPRDQVYEVDTPDTLLRLVTCGGSFDGDDRSYESNYVVFATHVGTQPSPTAGLVVR